MVIARAECFGIYRSLHRMEKDFQMKNKIEQQRAKEWIERLKKECKGLTPEQLKEVTNFAKYKAWCAINDKFDFVDSNL